MESDFPDKLPPFYKIEYGYKKFDKPVPDDQNPGDPKPDPSKSPLRITKTEWNKEKRTLKVKGKGDAGQIVCIFDAYSGFQLGAVSVNQAGKWKFYLRKPSHVPSRLQA